MDRLSEYITRMSSPEGELLGELTRTTYQQAVHPQMLSGHIQGKFLEMLTRMMGPRRVLEIGTFTGYSAISIAAGLEDGAVLDTIEANEEMEDTIRSFVSRSGYEDRIRLHIGDALDIMPHLEGSYDLVFIDADKREYPKYYRMLVNGVEERGVKPLVRSGSYLLADNILWYGKVADPDKYADPHTKAIIEFNRMVREDKRVENVILPLRDGLNLIMVK